MNITSIRESGSNNILLWAIRNHANIVNDIDLQRIINDEMFYLVTLSDVNFFEVFRLSQVFREKLRIIKENKAEEPADSELDLYFPGTCVLDESKPDEQTALTEIAKTSIKGFFDIMMQMSNDSDIISPSLLRLFIPMITRKFEVQIPIGFYEFLSGQAPAEVEKIFTIEYPNTLETIPTIPDHSFMNYIMIAFVKSTSIITYDKTFDTYINVLKYSPLKACKNNKLYKIGLVSFFKYDNIGRGEARFTMFGTDKQKAPALLKRIGNIKTPLYVDFAVELPIQYMQLLCNMIDREELTISYESSAINLIQSQLNINDVLIPEVVDEKDTDEAKIQIKHRNNAISAYQTRITEINNAAINALTLILSKQPKTIEDPDIDVSKAFSLLPSVYNVKAVITFNTELINTFTKIADTVLAEMFEDIHVIINQINEDINPSK